MWKVSLLPELKVRNGFPEFHIRFTSRMADVMGFRKYVNIKTGGKFMTGAFHIESRLFRIVDKAVSLVKLNILWILFSIPLVTGGAALCALHVTAVRILKNEEGYIFRDFWNVFRDKLALSLRLWVPLMAAAAALFLDGMFWRNVEGNFAAGMRVMVWVLSGIWIVLVIYIFPLAARMDTTAGVIYRSGILLLFKYLPQSVYLLFITGVFFAAGILWTPVFCVGALAGGALAAVVHGKMLLWIFEKEEALYKIVQLHKK